MSFGMLADGGILVPIGLTSLAIAVSAWLFWMAQGFGRVQRLAAPLIAGGAIGNAIDRLRFGKVVDLLMCIMLAGTGQLLIWLMRR